jgi:hypothetical protein
MNQRTLFWQKWDNLRIKFYEECRVSDVGMTVLGGLVSNRHRGQESCRAEFRQQYAFAASRIGARNILTLNDCMDLSFLAAVARSRGTFCKHPD